RPGVIRVGVPSLRRRLDRIAWQLQAALPEIVDGSIVGNPQNPGEEIRPLRVVLVEGSRQLDEDLLCDVLRVIVVRNDAAHMGEDAWRELPVEVAEPISIPPARSPNRADRPFLLFARAPACRDAQGSAEQWCNR